jgi:hypothetical protein
MDGRGGFALLGGKRWPTPDANVMNDGEDPQTWMDRAAKLKEKHGNGNGAGMPLAVAGAMWMTPNVPNGGRSVSAEPVASKGMTKDGEKKTVGLESQTRHWATPTASEATGAGHPQSKTGAPNLRTQTSYWSTPDVSSGARDMSKIDPQAQKRANTKRTIGLPTEAANWPTPTARDHKGGGEAVTRADGKSRMDMLDWRAEAFSRPVQSILDGRELSPTTRTLRPRLNPAFACWLMGWPIWWTNPAITSSAKSAMVSYRFRLQSALSSLLNEQGSSVQLREAA